MSPKSVRAQRLMDLYALRTRVVTEIAEIETAVQREAENVSRLREQFAEFQRNQPSRSRRAVAECGTDGGYHHHRRQLKEPACDACRMAHNAAERDRASRRRAS